MKTFALILSLYAQDGTIERQQLYSGLPASSCAETVSLADTLEALPAFASLSCIPQMEV